MFKKVKTIHEAVTCAVERAEEWARLGAPARGVPGNARVLEIADATINEWRVHLADRRMSNFVHLREI